MQQEITVLYEDDHILAIDKPAGLMVHGDGKHDYPTVTDWFVKQYPDSSEVGEEPIETKKGELITRSGVVHRLDRDTSGVMLLTKTDRGHACLKEQFQNRTVAKTYTALVYGLMKEDQYTVNSPIGRSKNFGRWTAIPKSLRGNAREAETEVTVLKRYEIEDGLPRASREGYTLVEARPRTGRTHQIRVHLQYLNYPIVADPLYAGKRNTPENNLGFERQALHAQSICFENVDGETITVNSDLPKEFTILETQNA